MNAGLGPPESGGRTTLLEPRSAGRDDAHPEADASPELQLLEAVFRKSGYDFRDYDAAHIARRIQRLIAAEALGSIARLREKVLHDPAWMERLLLGLTVPCTAMFRDPGFFASLRTRVVPLLRRIPFARVWVAGCATGEEAYSLAILLAEAGLARRLIYATDLSAAALAQARAGIVPLAAMRAWTGNYLRSGGTRPFSDYYTARYDNAILRQSLRDHLVFAEHNLVSDASFQEFDLVLCRNVMIYFNDALAARVHRLIFSSLVPGGVLCLGSAESIRFTPHEKDYDALDSKERIYRRKGDDPGR